MKEFDLIGRYFSDSGHKRKDVVIGIGDDCAVTTVPENQQLAVTTDTLVAGVHFLKDAPAKSIAYKTVAVNLSDLAAMGAEPAWISLSLSLPDASEQWLTDFVEGLHEITQYYSVQLIGGDTVKGPMAMTITAQGFIPPGSELTRSKAKPGDWVYVTGSLGDAGAGLDILQNTLEVTGEARDVLINRHYFPTPRVAVGTALRRLATSCIDISDGLLSDLGHILKSSGCGANIHVDRLPLSRALTQAVSAEDAIEYALSAGDDYELLFTASEEQKGSLETSLRSTNVKATCIGQLTGQSGALTLLKNNEKFVPKIVKGYEHSF
ncbi:thiamine-phosphate kinase [Alteromonas sp. A079]|uniref:thiamine-phosphate kinase n=1 Tax=Alteromonas sp. A079 TaxID=3410268 RepID=UPI003BA25206